MPEVRASPSEAADGDRPPVSGPVLFARYAFPPNQHGYCGPSDAAGFFTRGVAGDDPGLRRMARDFDGALPYLQLIADCNGAADALDRDVVEAYWLGGPQLDRVSEAGVTEAVELAFRQSSGPLFASIGDALAAGALPHHSFVVFCVYPWVAMLGDVRRTPQAMTVLDRCRIRWGQVIGFQADLVMVESRPLIWDGQALTLGPAAPEPVRRTIDGVGLSGPLAAGDWVALHWDWVCDPISEQQRDTLAGFSARHVDLVNAILADRTSPAGLAEHGRVASHG